MRFVLDTHLGKLQPVSECWASIAYIAMIVRMKNSRMSRQPSNELF